MGDGDQPYSVSVTTEETNFVWILTHIIPGWGLWGLDLESKLATV